MTETPELIGQEAGQLVLSSAELGLFLQALINSSDGFVFIPNPEADPQRPYDSWLTFTNPNDPNKIQQKIIFYNPAVLDSLDQQQALALFLHEAGHHKKEVLQLGKLIKKINEETDLPKGVSLEVINGTVGWCVLDAFLDNLYRFGAYPLADRLTVFSNKRIVEKSLELGIAGEQNPDSIQFIDLFVFGAYATREQLSQYSQTSLHAWQELKPQQETLDNIAQILNDPFCSKEITSAVVKQAGEIYKDYLLPAFLKLLNRDMEKEAKRQNLNLTLATPEQLAGIVAKIISLLKPISQQLRPLSITPAILEKAEPKSGKPTAGEEPPGIPSDVQEFLRKLQLMQTSERRGLAEELKVKPESIATYETIVKKRQSEINSLTNLLIRYLRTDRLSQREYTAISGEITPGLEAEYITARLSGNPEPATHMRETKASQFLSTDLFFWVDTSGSMSGTKITYARELVVIFTEAFTKAKKLLAAENLLISPQEQPLRVGVVGFDVKAKPFHDLGQPLSSSDAIKFIDGLSATGGGTDDYAGIKPGYESLVLNEPHNLKVGIVLTDGAGNKALMKPFVDKMDRDGEILLMVCGTGPDTQDVVEVYKKPGSTNIFADSYPNVEIIFPAIISFLELQLKDKADKKRRMQSL